MKIKNVFLVTPLGKERSKERIHADRMYNSVFEVLKEEKKYSFMRANISSGFGIFSENIFSDIKKADLVVADIIMSNLNVFYEAGLAHALNKPVIFIGPDNVSLPSNVKHINHISYREDIFNNTSINSDEIDKLVQKLKIVFDKIEAADKDELFDYIPYLRHCKDITPEVLSTYNNVIDDLRKIIDELQSRDNVFTEYIEGESKTFDELTKAVKAARDSIFTTRFSPYTVKGKQNTNTFYQTIKQVMDRNQEHCPREFQRIVATNHKEKLDEVLDLVRCNVGNNFTIHLYRHELNFEIVIIDKKTVFIHFKRKEDDRSTENKGKLVSATLKVMNPRVAAEFEAIFHSIAKNASYSIRCNDLNNIGNLENEITNQFEEGLKYCETNFKNIDNNNINE